MRTESWQSKLVESLKTTRNYIVIYEEEYRDKALQVALDTGSSGLDAYIIALAWSRNALLITDDEPMGKHAERLGVNVIILRRISLRDLSRRFKKT